nr:hypothetical protein [Tanacetum cinerariifolium]
MRKTRHTLFAVTWLWWYGGGAADGGGGCWWWHGVKSDDGGEMKTVQGEPWKLWCRCRRWYGDYDSGGDGDVRWSVMFPEIGSSTLNIKCKVLQQWHHFVLAVRSCSASGNSSLARQHIEHAQRDVAPEDGHSCS